VAEQRVDVREVEVEVRERVLEEVVMRRHDLPFPARLGHRASIGAFEILGAIGLIVPAVTGIAPILVPLAALGLVVVMLGAAVVHTRRKESQVVIFNVILLLLAAVVAWGRFGPYAF